MLGSHMKPPNPSLLIILETDNMIISTDDSKRTNIVKNAFPL